MGNACSTEAKSEPAAYRQQPAAHRPLRGDASARQLRTVNPLFVGPPAMPGADIVPSVPQPELPQPEVPQPELPRPEVLQPEVPQRHVDALEGRRSIIVSPDATRKAATSAALEPSFTLTDAVDTLSSQRAGSPSHDGVLLVSFRDHAVLLLDSTDDSSDVEDGSDGEGSLECSLASELRVVPVSIVSLCEPKRGEYKGQLARRKRTTNQTRTRLNGSRGMH